MDRSNKPFDFKLSDNNSWFAGSPEQIAHELTVVKEKYGDTSNEYATTIVALADAHMNQGSLFTAQAHDCYEQALQIFCKLNDESAEAWLLDKLASVKYYSGDSEGAELDLKRAFQLWTSPDHHLHPEITKIYIERRSEDLARIVKVNRFNQGRPPQI